MFCFLFLLCLEYKLWKAAWPLLCTDSSWNPSEHNFQPVENIHCHPNTQETSTHSAQPLPHRCPDISCNEMSWKNPAKHYRTVTTNTDTLQFVYNAKGAAANTVTYLLHLLLQPLDSPGNYTKLLFVDFSSAFNTIQKHRTSTLPPSDPPRLRLPRPDSKKNESGLSHITCTQNWSSAGMRVELLPIFLLY